MNSSQTGKKFRVGVVGAGNISSAHLYALQKLDNVEVVGIADTDLARAQQVAAEYKVPQAFGSLKELAKAKPDVVHILTPPASHCTLTIEALDIGFDVFVEKPMALTTEECDRMIAKARSVQRTLSVNHSARFDPPVLQALQLVKDGAIGDVLAVQYIRSSEYPPFAGGALPAHYRDGGYPFRDIGVHALYVIEAFLGEIRDVNAKYRSTGRNFHLRFDEWNATVECEKGAGQIYLSWNSRPMENGLIVQGTAGTLIIDSFLETCRIRRTLPGPKVVSLVWNAVMGSLSHAVRVCWNLGLFALGKIGPAPDIRRSIHSFYQALAEGAAMPVSVEEGRRVVGWVDQIASEADRARDAINEAEPELKPASILVTGATGFLGRATVAALLASDESIRLLARRKPTDEIAANPQISFVQGDLGQPEVVDRAMQGIETVYHIGAATGGSAEDYESGTICGTTNVVRSALRCGVKRMVYVSSLSVLDYASLRNGARVDERSAVEPFPEKRGLYAQTKLRAERIVQEAGAKGLKSVILRPGQIFGPGAEKVPPYATFSIGNHWIAMGNGKTELPLIYVDDVVDAMLRASESDTAVGHILQLVDPEVVQQREYLKYCKSLPEIKVTYVPMFVLYVAATGLQVLGAILKRSVPLTFYRLRSLKASLQFDCTAAKQKLGWNPRIGVREGLRKTFGGPPARLSVEDTKSQAPAAL